MLSDLRYNGAGSGRRDEALPPELVRALFMLERIFSMNDFCLTCGLTGCSILVGRRSKRFMNFVRRSSNWARENVFVVDQYNSRAEGKLEMN